MPNVMEIWEAKPPGTLWATLGLSYLYLFTGMEVITNSEREEIDHLTKDDMVMVCVEVQII
jgi:hypothetical protein